MSYGKLNLLSNKERLAYLNQQKLHYFKLNNENNLEIYTPSWLPGILATYQPEYYQKECFPLNTGSVAIITKNNEVNSFIWKTTAQKVKQAVRFGIVETQSVTGKVVACLGQYRLIQLERIQNGYISDRYDLKEALTDLYQERIEALQSLESLGNRFCDKESIEQMLQDYIVKLNTILFNLNDKLFHTNWWQVDAHAIQRLKAAIKKDMIRAEAFKQHYDANSFHRTTGLGSVITFVKTQILRNLREMQSFNQTVTYSNTLRFAATRGELNNYIEDAVKIIEDYEALPHDIVTADHHGDYGDANEKVIYDSTFHCQDSKHSQKALLAISFLEKTNKFEDLHLHNTQLTNWKINGGYVTGLKRLGAWILNISIKLLLGIPDLLTYGLIKPLSRLAAYEITIQNPEAAKLNNLDVLKKLTPPKLSLGVRFRFFMNQVFKRTVLDIFYGLRDVSRLITFHLLDETYKDYLSAQSSHLTLNKIFKQVDQEIILLKPKIENQTQDILSSMPASYGELHKVELEDEPRLAAPEYLPCAGEWNDVLSSIADGSNQFMSFFLHNIHAKHPFAGLLFTMTYITGGAAVLAPNYVSFLGSQYINFSQGLGHSMAKGTLSAGISSGCTQAQFITFGFNALLHGSNSWLVKAGIQFEEDPATSLITMATAFGLGDLVVFKLSIPWLSEYLRRDLGKFPASALSFAGAKIGILLYELLSEPQEIGLYQSRSANKIRKYLREEYQSSHPNVDPKEVELVVENILNSLLRSENLQQLREAYTILQGKECRLHITERLNNTISDSDLQRLRLIYFLTKNKEYVSQLSAKTKYQLQNKISEYFSSSEQRSLNKLFHPSSPVSILRTTLGVIILYVTFPLRVLSAAVISCVQLSPKPFLRAAQDFGLKISYDVTRVMRSISKIIKAIITFPRRQVKTVLDVVLNSVFARTAALLTNSHTLSYLNYKGSAELDVAYEQSRQILSLPIDVAVQNVTSAHPVSTRRNIESSCSKIFKAISYTNIPAQQEDKHVQPMLCNEKKSDSITENICQSDEKEVLPFSPLWHKM